MAHYTDWLPTTRERQMEMARNWQDVAGTSARIWGIPPAVLQNFDVPRQAAVIRDMKRRHFLTPPANPDDLRKSFYTKRKKDVIEFDFGDSGKTAYFAVQIENEGKKGSWGPLVSALIP